MLNFFQLFKTVSAASFSMESSSHRPYKVSKKCIKRITLHNMYIMGKHLYKTEFPNK